MFRFPSPSKVSRAHRILWLVLHQKLESSGSRAIISFLPQRNMNIFHVVTGTIFWIGTWDANRDYDCRLNCSSLRVLRGRHRASSVCNSDSSVLILFGSTCNLQSSEACTSWRTHTHRLFAVVGPHSTTAGAVQHGLFTPLCSLLHLLLYRQYLQGDKLAAHLRWQRTSLEDEGWKRSTASLDFSIFNVPKKNSNSAQFIQGFTNSIQEQTNPVTTR